MSLVEALSTEQTFQGVQQALYWAGNVLASFHPLLGV